MSRQLATGEHDGEPEPGLPEPLPATERLLWQGSPDWRLLARHGFHLRKFALYFGVLIAWRGLATAVDGGSAGAVLGSMLWPLPLAAAALGFIALLALLVGRNTAYTLTDRRVVMRIGIVLTVTFNLPLSRIETVRLHALGKAQGDAPRAGDIALVLDAQDRIGYLHLWPHARPWHFRRTEPMLRALPQADQVARLLVDALAASVATSAANAAAPSAPARPVPEPSPAAAPAPAGDLRARPAHAVPARQPLPHAA